jgi:hypothetical protein
VSVALEVPLRHLTDVRPGRRAVMPSEDAERIFVLVSGKHRPAAARSSLPPETTSVGERPSSAAAMMTTP